jgi:histidinol phosphatase-like PHP family hydrolase
MPTENAEVARLFREAADLLEVEGANPFRVRAYRNAARMVESLPEPVDALVRADEHRLTELPGIGEDLAGKIAEIVRTGTLGMLRELRREAPRGAAELMRVPGLGPKRAAALGYEYLAVTDHTPAVRVAGGMDRAGLCRQWKRVDRLNARLAADGTRLTVLRGAEVDILADGTLDLDDATLAALDVLLVSLHSKLGLPAAEQTRRVLRALTHPSVDVFAHPTARLLAHDGRGRAGAALDMEQVYRAAADHGVLLEVDAQPDRLDLDDVACRAAIGHGVRISLGSDAHAAAELRHMRWGVDQARRGWAERNDVANTRSLADLPRLLHGGRR